MSHVCHMHVTGIFTQLCGRDNAIDVPPTQTLGETCPPVTRGIDAPGATAPPNRGFPIDFECRSYDSVTH